MTSIKILIVTTMLITGTSMAFSQEKANKQDTILSRHTSIRPYKEVIKKTAITSKGFISVHRLEDKFYFEIPDSLMNRELLLVNRIARSSVGNRSSRAMIGYGGDEISHHIIQFFRGPNSKVFMRSMTYLFRLEDSSANGLLRSVENSNVQPIMAGFDIQAISPDSNAVVIDVTDFINGDNSIFFFNDMFRQELHIGSYYPDKSYIEYAHAFPGNVEVRTLKTYAYTANTRTNLTYELNNSIILLPSTTMKPRLFDRRVGYFPNFKVDFDLMHSGNIEIAHITKWRLEPKATDLDKYRRGVLVEPEKPIVFYIDPATPAKWVPYLIQGVNDWQKAFVQAGFKNAIYAREAPSREEDSTWSLEDARYSAIVYKASPEQNASGPSIRDPRTGEILESHVNWYHNVTKLIHDWYFIQAGAIDPRARKMTFDDSLMGQLIRFVSSHEVGHALGLMHNFGASSTVPVDSLRSKKWVEANGICPSIMDYARFNYVAQPEDSLSEKGIFPRIGIYDKWAIEWGYRLLPDSFTVQQEKNFSNQWIIRQTKEDHRLWFGSEGSITDPRCQSEDLGDNPMKAGYYGIKNLERIVQHLKEWTYEPAENYQGLSAMYDLVLDQYSRYLFHVARYIGGCYVNDVTREQGGTVFENVNKKQQKEAMEFLEKQLFYTPTWIENSNRQLSPLKGGKGPMEILGLQRDILKILLSQDKLYRFILADETNTGNSYTINEYLTDLDKCIFHELYNHGGNISLIRRNLQKFYIQQLVGLTTLNKDEIISSTDVTDVISIVKSHDKSLLKLIISTIPECKDYISRTHLVDLKERLEQTLKIKEEREGASSSSSYLLRNSY
ncbi:MAG: zinc-dependent metalloprotease [Chitinophagaceae bacterium]|nr:zinc-dependent metalloprotease [Chitinophagaceae bacterium]